MAVEDVGSSISEALAERDEIPRRQITEIIEVLGEAAALEVLAEARRVQDEGGLAVRDGTRQRTVGGVFFSLAKARLPRADRNRIFRVKIEGAAPPEGAPPAPRPQPKKEERKDEPRRLARREDLRHEDHVDEGNSGKPALGAANTQGRNHRAGPEARGEVREGHAGL